MKQERRQIHRLLIRKEKKRKDMMTQYPYNKPRDEKKQKVNFTTELKRKLILSIACIIHKMRFVG
jgi:hypothetical protein